MIPTMHRLQFKSVGIFVLSMPTFLSVNNLTFFLFKQKNMKKLIVEFLMQIVKSSYSLLIILNSFTSAK